MTLVVGTDEAGYGPNLGPLVVAASLWRVAGPLPVVEATLADSIAAATAAAGGGRTPLWADSKTIYKPPAIAALERGVLAALACATGRLPLNWGDLAALTSLVEDDAASLPERGQRDALRLPTAGHEPACQAAADAARPTLAAAGVTLCGIVCEIVQPGRFNRLLDRGLNKSDILSQTTLALAAAGLARLRTTFPDEPAVIWCDRHGGRKRYAGVVARAFDCPLVQPISELADRSAYDLPSLSCRIDFAVGGEARGPVAVASMTAKYLRELSMQAFNAFWRDRAPDLEPTAGYPVDAARWREAAAPAIRAAGISADDLWRRA